MRVFLRKEFAILKAEHPNLNEEQLIVLFAARHREYQKRALQAREAKEAKRRDKIRRKNSRTQSPSSKTKTTPMKVGKVLAAPSGNLPDWDASHRATDVFMRGRMLSGGGYGLGKTRKH